MGKSENARNRSVLETYFKKGDKISRKHFEQLFFTEDGEILEKVLLTFLYEEVDSIVCVPDITDLFKAFLYVEVLVERYPEFDKKKIGRKLRKIVERIETIEEEKKEEFYSKKKVSDKIKKFKELIYELEDKIEVKKDNYYELLEYFIFEVKNISYIEKIFQTFDHAIRAKNTNGNTIFYSVVDKYMQTILSDY